MTSDRWGSERTMKFVQELKSYQCLWDYKSPTNRNRQEREAAFKKVAEEMNIPGFGVPEAKKKLRTLRSTYYQERRKIQNSILSGCSSASNLSWYKEMDSLLENVEGRRPTVENVCENSINNDTEETNEDLNLQEDYNSDSEQIRTECPQPASIGNVSRLNGVFLAIRELKKLQETFNKDGPSQGREEDQFDIFSKSVAVQLRNLSYKRAVIGQARIQKILTTLLLEDYECAERSDISPAESEDILFLPIK